ncbi:LysR family transcriptional regulator [Shewanella sp. WXL01]|uniref:LysR family transcriptional regulator n=1 Tax=Shewanella sp. WXL01 TaxID=2709721 RepID=UPI00143830AF|nr:LysR family transcriptional regulator [Shewanella sp. WXL01]NKF49926.1 LysR family transcriptional regulator [Shewanella sp. WXL01]
MINQINLADLRAFVIIAEQGNLTKAAEILAVSRSHVSRQLSSLEKQLGVTLVIRTTRSLKITQAGEQLLKQAQTALNQLDQALLATIDDNDAIRGKLAINCVGGPIGEDVVTELISDFMLQHPEVDIELDFSSHRIDLIKDEFDLAFRMGELDDAGFVGRKLMQIDMLTLASPAYLAKYGKPKHPSELKHHRCITGSVTQWRYRASEANTELNNTATDKNGSVQQQTSPHYEVNIAGKLRCKNGRTLVNAALKGNGIIRVPEMYCRAQIQSGELVAIMPNWHIASVPFYAIYHKDKYQPKRLRAFIEFCVERFRY